MIDSIIQDIKYGFRSMAKNRGFAAVAVITLALGIGANTAMFSVIEAVLLRPLPFPDPERLVLIWQKSAQRGIAQNPVSVPNFFDWREQNKTFEGIAAWGAYADLRASLTGNGEPEQIQYAIASWNLFSVLGATPALGASFIQADDQLGGRRAVLISDGLWRRRYGADSNVIGKQMSFDGAPYSIIGVLPRDFHFASFPREAEVWLPLGLDPTRGRRFVRGIRFLGVVGRLKNGVSLEKASAEMRTISSQLEKENPDFNTNWSARILLLSEETVAGVRQPLLLLLGAVGFVLLIACGNVANLLLARAAGRRREIAIRIAVGVGRPRLVRQFLTESLLYSTAGGLAGLLIALWSLDLLTNLQFQQATFYSPFAILPNQVELNPSVLAFCVAVSVLTGIGFGLAPALQWRGLDVQAALKHGGLKSPHGSRGRMLRSSLVVGQLALSLVLLIGAGLMSRSLIRLRDIDPGFRPENVIGIEMNLARAKYARGEQITAFYEQLLERVKALPGVQSAGAVRFLPLAGSDSSTGLIVEGSANVSPSDRPHASYRAITYDYFQTMRIPLLQGRTFNTTDRAAAARVAVVNEAMAQRLWPNQNPIGKRVALDFETLRFVAPNRPPEFDLAMGLREVIGVIGNVRHSSLTGEAGSEMYIPFAQRPERDMFLTVRAGSNPTDLASAIRREVATIDKDQPIARIATMSDLVSASVAQPRSNLFLMSAFAALALVLAAVGVYGVVSYSVAQRGHEIGLRMALGAKREVICVLILADAIRMAAAGVAIGLAGSLVLSRFIGGLLYGVSATDPKTFSLVAATLFLIVLLASYIPARRAARIDPMIALRCE